LGQRCLNILRQARLEVLDGSGIGNCANSSDRSAYGSTPFAFAVSTIENKLALATAPFTVSLNIHPFLEQPLPCDASAIVA
jgi:hypothetical protein